MMSLLFQAPVPFSQFGQLFANASLRYGFYDIILPFMLIFAIVYAILHKINVPSDKKNIQMTIALVIALMFLYPHLAGIQPDPVGILLSAIPNITVLLVGITLFLILMGLLKFKIAGSILQSLAVIGSLLAIIYLFMLGAGFTPFQWLAQYFPVLLDPQIQDLLIILLVFGLIVYFVVSDDSTPSRPLKETLKDWIGESE